MKANEIIEGKTQFYINEKYGFETIIMYINNKDHCWIKTEHFFSWLHINDKNEIVDLDNKKYKFRNHEQLNLLNF